MARFLAKSRAQCAIYKKDAEKCINTYNGQHRKVSDHTTTKPSKNLHTAISVNKPKLSVIIIIMERRCKLENHGVCITITILPHWWDQLFLTCWYLTHQNKERFNLPMLFWFFTRHKEICINKTKLETVPLFPLEVNPTPLMAVIGRGPLSASIIPVTGRPMEDGMPIRPRAAVPIRAAVPSRAPGPKPTPKVPRAAVC